MILMKHTVYLRVVVLCLLAGLPAGRAVADDINCPQAPTLPAPQGDVISVRSAEELHEAIASVKVGTTVLLQPGRYVLRHVLSITTDNVTVRGIDGGCESVHLVGAGMDNPDHQGVRFGFWINASRTTIANMTISDIYLHPIQINGDANSPRIYNVRLVNAGQQFIKSNPNAVGEGVDDGVVEYSVMAYSNGPPKTYHEGTGMGYTNGVDVHVGKNWRISNNVFKNFHTPDGADYLWNAAVLMWRGAAHTVTENNIFIDVDRAIAYGLGDQPLDHVGGVIRNNVVFMSEGLYSRKRRLQSDAALIVWHSPGTQVLHNTIVTNGNTGYAIETRFDSTELVVANNLTDGPVVHSEGRITRNLCRFTSLCVGQMSSYEPLNVMNARPSWFVDIASGDARLTREADFQGGNLQHLKGAGFDFYGVERQRSITPGAVERHW